jgi:hypothetical protein
MQSNATFLIQEISLRVPRFHCHLENIRVNSQCPLRPQYRTCQRAAADRRFVSQADIRIATDFLNSIASSARPTPSNSAGWRRV